jgi:hypothetical protein
VAVLLFAWQIAAFMLVIKQCVHTVFLLPQMGERVLFVFSILPSLFCVGMTTVSMVYCL